MTRNKRKLIPVVQSHSQPITSDVQHQVLDIVAGGYDAVKIAHALAKKNPHLFLELYREFASPLDHSWHRDVVQLTYANNKVSAIKLVREKTNSSLKDAKDIVDNLSNEMSRIGYMISPTTYSAEPVATAYELVYQQLVRAAHKLK